MVKNIKEIEETGAWGIELECVPEDLTEVMTNQTKMLQFLLDLEKKPTHSFYLLKIYLVTLKVHFQGIQSNMLIYIIFVHKCKILELVPLKNL